MKQEGRPHGVLPLPDCWGGRNEKKKRHPNPASERIHARLGFTCVGREPHTAYKFGWLGLSTWWLPLRRGNEKPEPTHPLTQEQVEEILGRYQA